MSESIREKIMQNLVATLESITVANGYNNSIRRVQRYEQDGLILSDVPCVAVTPLMESVERVPNPYATCTLSLLIDVFTRHDKQDYPASTGQYLITFIDDITTALMADETRNGYAMDTIITGNYLFDNVDGQPATGISMTVDILYRHKINNTTQQ